MPRTITRVWGTADEFDIEFTQGNGELWEAHVPPDLSDGQYAVEIHAINDLGETAYWTGILYMSQGIAYVYLDVGSLTFWLTQPKRSLILLPCRIALFSTDAAGFTVVVSPDETAASLLPERLTVNITEGIR